MYHNNDNRYETSKRVTQLLNSYPTLLVGSLVLIYRIASMNQSFVVGFDSIVNGAKIKLHENFGIVVPVSTKATPRTPPTPIPITTTQSISTPTIYPPICTSSTSTDSRNNNKNNNNNNQNGGVMHSFTTDGTGTIVLDDGTGNEFKLIRNELFTAMEQYYSRTIPTPTNNNNPTTTTTSTTSTTKSNTIKYKNRQKNKNNISHNGQQQQPPIIRRTG